MVDVRVLDYTRPSAPETINSGSKSHGFIIQDSDSNQRERTQNPEPKEQRRGVT